MVEMYTTDYFFKVNVKRYDTHVRYSR